MDEAVHTNASTASGISMKDLLAGLEELKSEVDALPPPMDLHVTRLFYALLKSRFSVPGDSDIRQFIGVAVIVDLPPNNPVPFVWVPRSTRPSSRSNPDALCPWP